MSKHEMAESIEDVRDWMNTLYPMLSLVIISTNKDLAAWVLDAYDRNTAPMFPKPIYKAVRDALMALDLLTVLGITQEGRNWLADYRAEKLKEANR